MVRRNQAGARSLGAIDGNLEKLKEQLRALQERIDSVDEDRLEIVAKAALDAFPEIDAGEYGDDLDAFFQGMHKDALKYRNGKAQAAEKAAGQPAPSVSVTV